MAADDLGGTRVEEASADHAKTGSGQLRIGLYPILPTTASFGTPNSSVALSRPTAPSKLHMGHVEASAV